MTTIIEKDSSAPAVLLILIIMILFVGGGIGFAYLNGSFGGTTVIENNKTVESKTVVLPVEVPRFVPATAPGPERPSQPQQQSPNR